MFLAAIIKTHADAEQDKLGHGKPELDESEQDKPEPLSVDVSAAALDADATWPSFKPRVSPSYFGRTGVAASSRARWT
jgi:hypothetical protein